MQNSLFDIKENYTSFATFTQVKNKYHHPGAGRNIFSIVATEGFPTFIGMVAVLSKCPHGHRYTPDATANRLFLIYFCVDNFAGVIDMCSATQFA